MVGTTALGPSWGPSLAGIITILCGAGIVIGGFVVPAATVIAIPAGIGMITAGIGLLFAKAKTVTGIGDKATTDTTKDGTKL